MACYDSRSTDIADASLEIDSNILCLMLTRCSTFAASANLGYMDVMTSYCYCYLPRGGYVMPGVCLSVWVSGCVCLGVWVSVCLLATLCTNYWTDLHENYITDVSVDKEELIKFRKSSASGSGSRNFWRILQHCEIEHFYWRVSVDSWTTYRHS